MQPHPDRTVWTVADLEQLPDDGNRYEKADPLHPSGSLGFDCTYVAAAAVPDTECAAGSFLYGSSPPMFDSASRSVPLVTLINADPAPLSPAGLLDLLDQALDCNALGDLCIGGRELGMRAELIAALLIVDLLRAPLSASRSETVKRALQRLEPRADKFAAQLRQLLELMAGSPTGSSRLQQFPLFQSEPIVGDWTAYLARLRVYLGTLRDASPRVAGTGEFSAAG